MDASVSMKISSNSIQSTMIGLISMAADPLVVIIFNQVAFKSNPSLITSFNE